MGTLYCTDCRASVETRGVVELCELHRALSLLYTALCRVIEIHDAEKAYTP